ncbi:type-2Aa cytolytic delta-endotoxin [Bacillus wiedmannii]|uniref:type-2Aa cytolytic delta-endotoxin n=1 Tax=Bacillus wiedmannii TaxID=1890302 RepID=UPI000D089272|nr:type-2Aa cytolytic delta-endotoxin [Bacillus wiedmannii]PRT14594.1 type-2Aa cytolytic delta-endotoxin [Bacillus wiedmannii]
MNIDTLNNIEMELSNTNQNKFSHFRQINLILPAEEERNFTEIFQVAPQYLAQALRLANAFQGAIDGSDLNFNFERALNIANGIPNSAVVKTMNQNVVQHTVQISVMVDQLKELIKTVLGFAISSPGFWNSVAAAITSTFTNLNTQEDSAWIFWKSESSTNTSYYYNILFSIQNAETGGVMAVLPIAFEISVNLEKKKVLFLTIRDSARYEVRVKAITLAQALDSNQRNSTDIFNMQKNNPYQSIVNTIHNEEMINKLLHRQVSPSGLILPDLVTENI